MEAFELTLGDGSEAWRQVIDPSDQSHSLNGAEASKESLDFGLQVNIA